VRASEAAPNLEEAIAVIGMAGRFPGAPDVPSLWRNLLAGIDSIERFPADALPADHPDPSIAAEPGFVGAEGTLDDIDRFDATFFGYSPREAAVMDPQHRLGLETAWHALEDAGYDPGQRSDRVGVFFATGANSYLVRNLLPSRGKRPMLDGLPLLVHNDKDFAATSIAHKLGLSGPAMAVGTACSSSLVAVHLAVQSLLTGESDAALAGGCSLQVPQRQGYVRNEDSIYSATGVCRPFDAKADGTVGGSGVAMVVLRRLADAVDDGDRVDAVILGTAVNNDGGSAPGFTAPSVTGQAAVIGEALAVAQVPADSIGFVEAHGTGTSLGDAIEIEGLTRAFRLTTSRKGFCALGSVKANLGHLDAAAGAVGLIKAVLAVRDGRIPGQPGPVTPNRDLKLAETPFYVSAATAPWPPGRLPRRAGVSSFGIGGTNAHVVIAEPPSRRAGGSPLRRWRLLTVSARDSDGLDTARERLRSAVKERTEIADTAYTLAGRRPFRHRLAVVCRDGAEAASELRDHAGPDLPPRSRDVAFLFPGQGVRIDGMSAELCREEPTFRGHHEACMAALADAGARSNGVEDQTDLFALEYALAQTLIEWGLRPSHVVGHSLGEFAAATLAGVLRLDEAARLVAGRARLLEGIAPGGMLAVAMGEEALGERLPDEVSLAAINGPDDCVVAGPEHALTSLARSLRSDDVPYRRLRVNRAFHSAQVEPILSAFADLTRDLPPRTPGIGWVSTLTGELMAADIPVDPDHWVKHMREPVRFGDAVARLPTTDELVLIEVGPDSTLSSIVRRITSPDTERAVFPVRPASVAPAKALLTAVGRAWTLGCAVDRRALFTGEHREIVECPPYPFRRERHWIDPPRRDPPEQRSVAAELPTLRARNAQLTAANPVRGISDHQGLGQVLDQLCTSLILRYLDQMGVATVPGTRLDKAEVHRRLGVVPSYMPFVDFMLSVLADEQVLADDTDEVVFLDHVRPPDPAELAESLKARHPGFAGLVDLLMRCGAAYPKALTVSGGGLEVLYPNGQGELLQRELGERTVEFSVAGRMAKLLAGLVRDWSDGTPERPLRILEVGAGGGRLTWEVAQALKGRRSDYLVSDISRLFLDDIQEQALQQGHQLSTARFDIAQPPGPQGLPPRSFDMVIGLDVLHAAPDVPRAIANLKELLAPSGVLAFVETVHTDRWLSMVWGLSEDWWAFDDDVRATIPLLSRDQWRELIASQGFASTAVLPEDGDAAMVLAQVSGDGAAADPLQDLPDKRAGIDEWAYVPGWQRTAPVFAHARRIPADTRCLVFSDGPVGDEVVARLGEHRCRVVTVRPGTADSYGEAGQDWTLDIDGDPDYQALITKVAETAGPPDFVVHLWHAEQPRSDAHTLEGLDHSQRRGIFSLLSLVRGIAGTLADRPLGLLAVTAHAQDVLGGELLAPERSTVQAAMKVIPLEYPQLRCSVIDIVGADPAPAVADRLVAELLKLDGSESSRAETEVLALRGVSRWTPRPHAWRLPSDRRDTAHGPKQGGTYLICGGLGGIGLSLAESLLRLPARVALVRRRPFLPREEWPNAPGPDGEIGRRLLNAESEGGQALVLRGDVANLDDMRAVVGETVARFGPISGVIHAAGVLDTAGVIQRRTNAETWTAVSAKLRGPFVLEEALAGQRPDFVLFCGSIGSVLSKLKYGEVGYVAGNEFLGAYAQARAARGDSGVVTISWTDWLEAGMWADARRRLSARYAETGGPHAADDLLRGLTTAEGLEVFRRVLAGPRPPHVLISTQDLHVLLEKQASFTRADHLKVLETMRLAEGHPRPPLDDPFVAPRTAAEKRLAEIWSDLLGVEGIGVNDDFFALGGDSLVALRLLARLRDVLGLERTMAEMLEAPTIAGLLEANAEGSELDEVVL
jgi:acyl transferase domain-containing protein/SAM-dependent methyltransferase/acyl carrier protein